MPKHYEPESKKTVAELIDRKVIAPVDEPTTWCSPAFFILKADGKCVRLVTDFTALNKFVRRPTHPFPSTREIIEAIPPEEKLFCKLDAVHRYFQLALDEPSSKLTTFLIQQGRFRYLRAPMGLNASSDEWCRQSDIIIAGLPYAMKIVDDTIIWASTEEQLKEWVTTVLRRCTENNITISRKKFEMGNSIHFAGHIISDGGIRPDDDKFAALHNFQQPGNVKELRLFLGLVAQFGAFAPDTACLTSHLRQLLQKETPWVWLPEHKLDFENTKKALTSPTMLQPFDPKFKTVVLTDASSDSPWYRSTRTSSPSSDAGALPSLPRSPDTARSSLNVSP